MKLAEPTPRPLVEVGDVIRIREADYCYGVGALTMRVTVVGADPVNFPGLEWIRLLGVQIDDWGREREDREVLVRMSALRDPRSRVTSHGPGQRDDERS